MQISYNRHFSYCLNVHPGEHLSDMERSIREDVPLIRSALSPNQPFGLGLRIAREAATALADPRTLTRFQDQLNQQNLYAFTINGFPYGAFHNTRVKENVYLPDWSTPERLQYTCDLFDILATLLPQGSQGSVSTVPLAYRPAGMTRMESADEFSSCSPAFIENLGSVAEHLAAIEATTGKRLHLGLEPEPDCILETTDQTLGFFEALFRSSDVKEEVLRRHIGVCFDTCHVAMQFEDPAESLRRLHQSGITLSKIQISAALECNPSISHERLKPFDDGVYLHQIKGDGRQHVRDLPLWFKNPDLTCETMRIHAHVPMHWDGNEHLRSTRHTLTPDFWQAARESGCPHLEVETYTFDVLPAHIRNTSSVAEDMIQECQWALRQV